MPTTTHPTLADVEAARDRLVDRSRVTPVYGSETLRRLTGKRVWLKAENLQRTGSFKIRGAVNRIATLPPAERAAGESRGTQGQKSADSLVSRFRSSQAFAAASE